MPENTKNEALRIWRILKQPGWMFSIFQTASKAIGGGDRTLSATKGVEVMIMVDANGPPLQQYREGGLRSASQGRRPGASLRCPRFSTTLPIVSSNSQPDGSDDQTEVSDMPSRKIARQACVRLFADHQPDIRASSLHRLLTHAQIDMSSKGSNSG
jgi:hypothetical protein